MISRYIQSSTLSRFVLFNSQDFLKMLEFLKCGTRSLQNSAMIIAIIDVIATSILLILFVLGSSLMLAFEIIGKPKNATRILDIVTDDIFNQVQTSYDHVREKKDVAEDMGVWLIIMFLTIVDFIISCIFLDGVKTRDANKCQVWLNIRIVIIIVFKIIVLINLIYGTTLWHAIPDLLFTFYRLLGLYIGFSYLKELRNPLHDYAMDDEDENGKVKGNDSSSLPAIAISHVDTNDPSASSASTPPQSYNGQDEQEEQEGQTQEGCSPALQVTLLIPPPTAGPSYLKMGQVNQGLQMEDIEINPKNF